MRRHLVGERQLEAAPDAESWVGGPERCQVASRGGYGMALVRGLGAAHPSLPLAGRNWERWTMDWHPADVARRDRGMTLSAVDGGRVDLDLDGRTATIITRSKPSEAAFLHPWLSYIATVVAHFRDFDSFHAGGVIVDRS